VIIGPETQVAPVITSTIPAAIDFSKPLPDLPVDADPQTTPEISQTPMATPTTMAPIVTPSPAKARTYLAQQHLRTRTKRAFQTPSAGPSSFRLKQHEPADLTASTSTASTVSTVCPAPRRPTALEEAIGRSRAASAANATPSHAVDESPARMIAEPAAPRIVPRSPSLTGGIDLGLPIPEQRNGLMIPPQFERTDTGMSKASGKTVYTDASEGWGRSGHATPMSGDYSVEDTPSPTDEMSDRFKVRMRGLVGS
jgi:hypothetical protein